MDNALCGICGCAVDVLVDASKETLKVECLIDGNIRPRFGVCDKAHIDVVRCRKEIKKSLASKPSYDKPKDSVQR